MKTDPTRESLNLLLEISRELSSDLDLRTVLGRVLLLSSSNVGAERGSLIVFDSNLRPTNSAIFYAGRLLDNPVPQVQGILEQGLAGWVLRSRVPALVQDTSKDERWFSRPDDRKDQSGAKSAICVPLVAQDKVVGILTIVHPQPEFFTTGHLDLVQAIAIQAGIAVRNALLIDSLQAARRRFEELFEDSVEPILITDLHGRILDANRQANQAAGTEKEKLLGSQVFTLYESDVEEIAKELGLLSPGSILRRETIFKPVHGKTFPVEVHVRRINVDDIDLLQWIFLDITTRKELDSLREDLSAMIYHDLRSPLSNIISSLEMLDIFLPQQEKQIQSILQIARNSTDRLQRLISSLLDINRLESGNTIVNRGEVDMVNLLRDAGETVKLNLENKEQSLTIETDQVFQAVQIDGDMIRRVVINLLENAVKYTPEGGQIILGCRQEGANMEIWIEDDGPGIPELARQDIFNKFVRLKVQNAPKGIGLGLAFCRLAVEAHGGRIWVESGRGSGSKFIFNLPIEPAEAAITKKSGPDKERQTKNSTRSAKGL
jgi:two-component system, NtrC family, sensor histidine kinase KinB